MWRADEVEIIEFSIRGREYDPKLYGVYAIIPPSLEIPYWLVEFTDGTKIITTDAITVRIKENSVE